MKYRRKPNSYILTETPCGTVKGVRKNGYSLYKGIRYATAGRWEVPEAVTRWQGEYDATRFGPWCCQYRGFFGDYDTPFAKFYYDQAAEKPVVEYSEDCLNLNIWAPEGAAGAPVLVFVHGGSFVSGGNSATYIIGEEYCKRGIILVSVNYRMNAFASIYEAGYPANLGLRDQIAALSWIKANIAAFGGNPDRIIGIGESAGAISLQCLLYAPQAKGLLSGAIMMSGGGDLDALGIPSAPEYVAGIWALVKERYGVDSLDALKELPAKEVYTAWAQAAATNTEFTNQCAKPVIDGDIIPHPVAELVARGAVNDMPCIFGLSSEDMFPHLLYTQAVEWALCRNAAGGSPVYGYYMDRQLPGDDAGAYHACDLWYAFGSLDLNWRPFTEIDYRISENMIDYFAAFVKRGNPNDGRLAEWMPMTGACTQFVRFGDDEAAMYSPPVEQLAAAVQNTTKPFPGM